MRRLRRGAAGRLISPTWVWLIAGWVVWTVVFGAIAAARRPGSGFGWAAGITADAAWLGLVLFVNSLEELGETIANTPEPDRPSHRRGPAVAWGPAAAALIGLAVGWLAWK